MAPSPERVKAHEVLSADITRIAKKAKLPFRTFPDLVNTSQRYPELIPLLIDWLKNLDGRTPMTDPKDLAKFRDNLARALTTIDAMGTEAIPVLFDQFDLDPPMPPINSFAVANALLQLAVPSDYDRMAAVAADRTLGWGRVAVLEWMLKQGRPDTLDIVLDQIDDASVRAQAIRDVRRYKPVPSCVRAKIERYSDDPDNEVRRQVELTLAKLPQ